VRPRGSTLRFLPTWGVLLVALTMCFPPVSQARHWSRTFGTGAVEAAAEVVATPDCGFAVAGYYDLTGGGDFWVLKLRASGQVEWQQSYGGPEPEGANSIDVCTDGGLFLAGTTQSFGAGEADYWVLKLTEEGAVEWQRAFGGRLGEGTPFVRATAGGGCYLVGTGGSFAVHGYDIWALRLGRSGEVLWQKIYGLPSHEWARAAAATADGGLIVASDTNAYGPDMDFWIFKIDAAGDIEWQKTYGIPEQDFAAAVIQTKDGGYLVGGAGRCATGFSCDAWILRLDKDGEILWEKAIDTRADERVQALAETPEGGVLVGAWRNTLASLAPEQACCDSPVTYAYVTDLWIFFPCQRHSFLSP